MPHKGPGCDDGTTRGYQPSSDQRKTRNPYVLVAERRQYRRALEQMLILWGYTVVPVADGQQAWEVLRQPDTPRLAVLDWMMPGLDGVEVCRLVRQEIPEPPYLLLITGRGGPDDLVAGLKGAADEYLTKPVDPSELRVRVEAGWRGPTCRSVFPSGPRTGSRPAP